MFYIRVCSRRSRTGPHSLYSSHTLRTVWWYPGHNQASRATLLTLLITGLVDLAYWTCIDWTSALGRLHRPGWYRPPKKATTTCSRRASGRPSVYRHVWIQSVNKAVIKRRKRAPSPPGSTVVTVTVLVSTDVSTVTSVNNKNIQSSTSAVKWRT